MAGMTAAIGTTQDMDQVQHRTTLPFASREVENRRAAIPSGRSREESLDGSRPRPARSAEGGG
jgi:hypothetical protein